MQTKGLRLIRKARGRYARINEYRHTMNDVSGRGKPGSGGAPEQRRNALSWELAPNASSGSTATVVLLWYAAEAMGLAFPRGRCSASPLKGASCRAIPTKAKAGRLTREWDTPSRLAGL